MMHLTLCHPERSEGSPKRSSVKRSKQSDPSVDWEIPRSARNEKLRGARRSKFNQPMKRIFLTLLISIAVAISAQAKLNVVATLPDFGSLAREIGGDKINIIVLAKATEDPHFVDARPSFVVSLRNADALIDGGAELELGWLPPLLQNARNPKTELGKPGRIQTSHAIPLMHFPTTPHH